MKKPNLPLYRTMSSNGHVWHQADGTVFSFAEHEEWVWAQLLVVDRHYAALGAAVQHDPVTRQ